MNKLFSTLCWYGFICLPMMQGLTLWRFIWGPLHRKICFIQIVFMNISKWQSLLLFDAILLSRYTFVVWLKNPAAVNDDDAPSMTSRQFICRLARSTNKNRAWGRCHKQIFEYNTYVKIMHSDRSKHVTCIMQ